MVGLSWLGVAYCMCWNVSYEQEHTAEPEGIVGGGGGGGGAVLQSHLPCTVHSWPVLHIEPAEVTTLKEVCAMRAFSADTHLPDALSGFQLSNFQFLFSFFFNTCTCI